jgi:hypothetical protein
MNRKTFWPISLSIVGYFLSRMHTYGASATYKHDLKVTASYTAGGAALGLLIAAIVGTSSQTPRM